MTTPQETYLENLTPLLARLIGAVHDEGPDATMGALVACRALPAPPGTNPNDVIPIVLAAMIDPARRVSDLLAWTTQHVTLDNLPDPSANDLAVEMALAGVLPAHALNRAETDAVVDELLRRGWTETAIREHLQADHADTNRWIRAARHRAKRAA